MARINIGILGFVAGFAVTPAAAQVRPPPTEPRPAYLFLEFNTADLENHGRVVNAGQVQYGPSSGGPQFTGEPFNSPPAPGFQTVANRHATAYCDGLGYNSGRSLEVTAIQLTAGPNYSYAYRIKRLVCFGEQR